jgi:hypothetical protein
MSIFSQYCVTPGAHPVMTSSTEHEKAIAITISLLKHKSPRTVQLLKDLLTFIPNPNHIKSVLTTAVIQLIYTCPQSALWLFQHPEVVAPEVQVREIIVQEVTRKILSLGYTSKDFRFTADHGLEMSHDSKQALLSYQASLTEEPVLNLIQSLLSL